MRTILQHKYFSSLLIILVLTFGQSTFSQFEVNNAITELSVLQEKLNSTNINEPTIKDVRERSLSLRASALRCVDEIEPLVETLKLEVEALEQINPEVDIEIYERLSKARNKLGWQPKTSFPELVRIMVMSDVKRLKRLKREIQ